MCLESYQAEVVVWAPAKLNLFLEILGRRDDGFHEIETLMTTVSLFDTLCFSSSLDGRISFEVCWAEGFAASADSLGVVPCGADNLVLSAVRMLRNHVDLQGCVDSKVGAHMRLIKRIPAAAGLGGASSDAAAALVAANRGWNLGLGISQLQEIAQDLGSDVPFFLEGGAAICRGRGEKVTPMVNVGHNHFVIARPPEGLSTAKVYAASRLPREPRQLSCDNLPNRLRGSECRQLLFNRLQEPAAELSPWVDRLSNRFQKLGFLGHQMSGSGTCYFGVARNLRHARRARQRLLSYGESIVYLTTTVTGRRGPVGAETLREMGS